MLPPAPPDFPSTSHTTPRTQLLCLWPILTSLLLSIILRAQEPSPPPPQLWSVLWTSLMDRSSPAPTLPSRPTLPGTGVRDLQAAGPRGCVGVQVPACLPSTLLARYSPGTKGRIPAPGTPQALGRPHCRSPGWSRAFCLGWLEGQQAPFL